MTKYAARCSGTLIAIALSGVGTQAVAVTARTLPAGIKSFSTSYYHYSDISERYNENGDKEQLDVNFNTNLNGSIFPALNGLNAMVGGSATLGRSVVDFELQYRWWEFGFDYGVSDKFTVGLLVPYLFSRNEVSAELDASTANVGKNALYGSGGDPFGVALIPTALGGSPLVTGDIQNLLGSGLDVNGDGTADVAGYGYDRIETFDDNGVGDIELVGKYKFHEDDKLRAAVGFGLRLPTGQRASIDNLTAVPFGDEQTDILFRFYADYKIDSHWSLNGSLYYDWQLEESTDMRVVSSVDVPITSNKETVDLDLGDMLTVELVGTYAFNPQWSTGLKYVYSEKSKDQVTGSGSLDYSALEQETDFESHMGMLKVGYSTIERYQSGATKVPYMIDVTYRDRFKGKNNVTVSQFIAVEGRLFFE